MFAAAPEWQAGDWHVDRTAAWTEPLRRAGHHFPERGARRHVDMMSQAAAWLLQASVPTFTISHAFTGEILAQY
jgi:hypothetical protein